MTPLAKLLFRQIKATGPITIAEYMGECLFHPEHGYYATRDPFGKAGDFTTAPEISQMFGELLGLCMAQCWLDQGSPASFTLAELGPGRGTLMADLLRATRAVPGFHSAARVSLVEASPHLRSVQRATLANYDVTWFDDAQFLPDAPLFILANEFFDALPIRQFSRGATGWHEHMVRAVAGELSFGLAPETPIALLEHRLQDTRSGDVVETCSPASTIVQDISRKISVRGGAGIFVDYGGWHSLGDTFQALRDHKMEDPLCNPGNADLTAHVDFEALTKTVEGVTTTAMATQGALLRRLGIEGRATQLAAKLAGKSLENHTAALRRLTSDDEMGSLFKVIAIHHTGSPTPAGFET